jgi:hypothetical protein
MPRTCHNIELVCADALRYEIPDDVTTVFLNNPFRGATFKAVIDKLIESHDRAPRRLTIIYNNPADHELLMQTGRFRKERTFRRHTPRKHDGVFGATTVYRLLPAP